MPLLVDIAMLLCSLLSVALNVNGLTVPHVGEYINVHIPLLIISIACLVFGVRDIVR